MNDLSKSITKLYASITAHLPAELKFLIEMELTSYFLKQVNLTKFVGSLSPTLFATLSAAIEVRKAKENK